MPRRDGTGPGMGRGEKEEVVVLVGVVALLKGQVETASAQSVAKEYLINRE